MSGVDIPYETVTAQFRDTDAGAPHLAAYLSDVLPGLWCDAYSFMARDATEIVQLTDEGCEFLFDLGYERVVAAFGRSRAGAGPRDRARMQGFLGRSGPRSDEPGDDPPDLARLSWRERFLHTHGAEYDRGHFISHLQGGGLDINLFPQLADVNRGWSAEGGAYRAMERQCAARPGTFCFARPLYADDSWVPEHLEYGVQTGDSSLQVRVFPNRPARGRMMRRGVTERRRRARRWRG